MYLFCLSRSILDLVEAPCMTLALLGSWHLFCRLSISEFIMIALPDSVDLQQQPHLASSISAHVMHTVYTAQ